MARINPFFLVNVKVARKLGAISRDKAMTLHMIGQAAQRDLPAVVSRAPNPPEFASGFVSEEIVASDEDDFAAELGVFARSRKLGNNLFRHQVPEKSYFNKVFSTCLENAKAFLKVCKF